MLNKHHQEKGKKRKSKQRQSVGIISDSQILKVTEKLYSVHSIQGDVPHSMDYDMFLKLFKETNKLYTHLITHNGLEAGTKRFTEIRRYFNTLIILGKADIPKCLSVTKKGYPRILNYMKPYAKRKNMRIINTILNITRLSSIGNTDSCNFSSIRSGTSKDPNQVFRDFAQDLPSILKELNVDLMTSNDLNFKWLDAQKKGPNSGLVKKNAIESSFADVYSLSKDLPLFNALKNLLNISGNLGIITLLDVS